MFNFVKNFLAKTKTKSEYYNKLKEYLSDNKLDKKEKAELIKLSKKFNLTGQDLISAHKKACSLSFSNITSDRKITEEEKKSLQELMKYFNVDIKDFDFNQESFNKFYTLGLIDKGVLPEIKNHDIDVIFKKSEKLHWGCPASLKKYKRVTNRINYGGLTGSIKIVKGVRYRYGSVGFSTQSSEYLITEDVGAFWMTNQRLGFRGQRKSFVMPYSKILSFEVTRDGLFISKEGKENAYILHLKDYEVPCAIFSLKVNE